MAFDESKVTRDDRGRFKKRPGSKSNGRNVSGTSGRTVAGVWSIAPYDKPQPNHRPGERA